MHKICNSK